jgi:hypothetical protein
MAATVDHMLEVLNDEDRVTRRLSTWELDFVESVSAQHEAGRELTPGQRQKLEDIYAEKTD